MIHYCFCSWVYYSIVNSVVLSTLKCILQYNIEQSKVYSTVWHSIMSEVQSELGWALVEDPEGNLYTTLYWTIPYCNVLYWHCTVLHCSVLHCTALQYSDTALYTPVQCIIPEGNLISLMIAAPGGGIRQVPSDVHIQDCSVQCSTVLYTC